MIRHVFGRKKLLRNKLERLKVRKNLLQDQIREYEKGDREKEKLTKEVATMRDQIK